MSCTSLHNDSPGVVVLWTVSMENLQLLLWYTVLVAKGLLWPPVEMLLGPFFSLFRAVSYPLMVDLRLGAAGTRMVDWSLAWPAMNLGCGEAVKLALAKPF